MTDYKLVAVEPTREMWAAAGDAVVALNSQHHDAISEAVYKAMLAASPAVQVEPVAWATRLYNTAYHAGHHDTVEGNYTHVYPQDMDSYHEDIVQEWLADNPQPAVHREPIGWCTEDHLDDKSATTYSAEVAQRWRDKGWPVWPLYTTPQPAEQQPSADSLTPIPDEAFAAEFSAWWDKHGQLCRAGGGNYERTFAFEAWRHLYPQLMSLRAKPAPDVSALVEALECALETMENVDGANDCSRGIDAVEEALAAHRKGDDQ